MPFTKKMTLADLDRRAASSLQHVRNILSAAHADALREIEGLEKDFYGSKNTKAEVGKSARFVIKVQAKSDRLHSVVEPSMALRLVQCRAKIKGKLFSMQLMKEVNLSWLTEPIHMDRLATRAIYHDETDLTPMLKQARAIYDKTWSFIPSQIEPVVEKIETILRQQKMYCTPVYNPLTDPSVQIGTDYHGKIKTWTTDVKKYLTHARSLHDKFQKGALFLDEMSQSTRELAMKVEAEDCPFVFAVFEACEVMREAVRCLQSWLTVANEYASFLTGEMEELQQRKAKLQHKALKQQDKYNKENYRLLTLKHDLDAQREEQASLQSKEMELLVREELLKAKVNEMKIDFDIKEFRLSEMQRMVNPKTAAQKTLDSIGKLAEEVRVEGNELNDLNKEISLIRVKMAQLTEKQQNFHKLSHSYSDMVGEVHEQHRSYLTTSKELSGLTRTIDHIKYMIQYLVTPDTAQKIFLDLPRRREALGISRSHGLNIQGGDDMMDKVFDVLSNFLGKRWPQIYRELPFYPPRGQNTIETDIRQIQIECVRDSLNREVRKSLERWRRFHTRARPAELLLVVERLGDQDILKAIDRIVNPPRPKTPVPETFPTFLDESLIPYYQQVSRYDSLKFHQKESSSPVK